MNALAARLAPLGVALVTRIITPGDEAAFPDPTEPLARRCASGAARLAAREALASLGGPADAALPRSPGRFPIWPAGFVGSLAHDDTLAVAAVARAGDMTALGIDLEPAEPLPDDVAAIALFGPERGEADPVRARLIFAAKEAVYKAINPLDGSPLEYEDIAVDFPPDEARNDRDRSPPPLWGRVREGVGRNPKAPWFLSRPVRAAATSSPAQARLRDGRTLRLHYARDTRWIVVALMAR